MRELGFMSRDHLSHRIELLFIKVAVVVLLMLVVWFFVAVVVVVLAFVWWLLLFCCRPAHIETKAKPTVPSCHGKLTAHCLSSVARKF